jgi:hypothetical protein
VPDPRPAPSHVHDALAELHELEAWCREVVATAQPHGEDVQGLEDDADRYRRAARHLDRLTRPR